MRARGTTDIPLAPRPDLKQYRKLAKELAAACHTLEADAVRAWAAAWIERLARLQVQSPTPDYVVPGADGRLDWTKIKREVGGIVESARQAHLLDSGERPVTLSDAQLFLARLHGFQS